MDADGHGLAARLPFPLGVLKRPNELFLLGIHRDDGGAASVEGVHAIIDKFELLVPIGMRRPLQRFLRRLQTVPTRVQELPDFLRTDREPLSRQLGGEFARALRRPPQRRLGSPRVTGSTRVSSASTMPGLVSSIRERPPPARRTPTTSSAATPARSSSRPARMVVRDKPVARSTIAMPPSPSASASAPAHNRVSRSSITGRRATNLPRTVVSSSSM